MAYPNPGVVGSVLPVPVPVHHKILAFMNSRLFPENQKKKEARCLFYYDRSDSIISVEN